MDRCLGEICGMCIGALCAHMCIAACEDSTRQRTETPRERRNRQIQFEDMYPQMQQPRSQNQGYARTNQDDDVWNISSRVNQQGSNSGSDWPTHDHRISVHDFVLTPDYNSKDTRPPPPPYSEVDLPSYEQATGCRPPRPDLTPIHQAQPSSSSSSQPESRPGPSS